MQVIMSSLTIRPNTPTSLSPLLSVSPNLSVDQLVKNLYIHTFTDPSHLFSESDLTTIGFKATVLKLKKPERTDTKNRLESISTACMLYKMYNTFLKEIRECSEQLKKERLFSPSISLEKSKKRKSHLLPFRKALFLKKIYTSSKDEIPSSIKEAKAAVEKNYEIILHTLRHPTVPFYPEIKQFPYEKTNFAAAYFLKYIHPSFCQLRDHFNQATSPLTCIEFVNKTLGNAPEHFTFKKANSFKPEKGSLANRVSKK